MNENRVPYHSTHNQYTMNDSERKYVSGLLRFWIIFNKETNHSFHVKLI